MAATELAKIAFTGHLQIWNAELNTILFSIHRKHILATCQPFLFCSAEKKHCKLYRCESGYTPLAKHHMQASTQGAKAVHQSLYGWIETSSKLHKPKFCLILLFGHIFMKTLALCQNEP